MPACPIDLEIWISDRQFKVADLHRRVRFGSDMTGSHILMARSTACTCSARLGERSLRQKSARAVGANYGRLIVRAAAATQESTSDTKFQSYSPRLAYFFPGQGAQTIGMAKDIVAEVPAAKDLFAQASDILGYDLLNLCTEGPKEKLNSTVISQPAIYVASLAALEKLRQDEGDEAVDAADVTCGLSLGEYTALTYAKAISFADGLKLVKLRGESMQAAANSKPSSMVSVLKLDVDQTKELCQRATEEVGAENGVTIANYLCPGNYAVSGGVKGCDAVERLAKEYKARCMRLAVAGAFHTQYMQPAEEKLREALASTSISTPQIPVISNVDAQPHSDPEVIKDILARQLTSPVQWQLTLETLIGKGLERSIEIGPNKVIAGIMKRINKDHNISNVFA